jgi:hypothetical protein
MFTTALTLIKITLGCKLAALAHTLKAAALAALVLAAGQGNLLAGATSAPAAGSPQALLAERYGWTLTGEWPEVEAAVLLHAARGVERYVAQVSGADGRLWMQTYLGPITFHRANWFNRAVDANLALGRNIYVLEAFGGSVEPYTDLVHEVAHVLDNNQGGLLPASLVGGGPADRMLADLGGAPHLCWLRFLCPAGYAERISGPESWPAGLYANTGVAEDFAEAFAYAAFFPERVPARRLAWVEGFVVTTAHQIKPGR